jgi:hypothetical protein
MPCANALWMADVMDGPILRVGDRTVHTFLFALLDDCSRLVPHAQYYDNQKLPSLLDCLKRGFRTARFTREDRTPAQLSQESAHEHSAMKSESYANTKTGRTSSSLNIQRFCNCVDGIYHAGVLSIVNKFYFQNVDCINPRLPARKPGMPRVAGAVADTRLGDVQNLTSPAQAAFLCDRPEVPLRRME